MSRGGSAYGGAWDQRSASRVGDVWDSRSGDGGFRLVSPLPERVEPSASPVGWPAAIDAVARNEMYGGLALLEQEGLTPLGPDPHSGLHEFAVEGTGATPTRSATTGRLLLTDDFAIVLVLMPGGTFWMGAQQEAPDKPNHDWSALNDEAPVHQVTVPPFFLAKYEMTRAQWAAMGGGDPHAFEDSERLPVDSVSWNDCRKLLSRRELRLPSEAEWEYACRAGTTTPFWVGESAEALARVEWCAGESGGEPHAVGVKPSNPFGLHDMHGNAAEWCEDRYRRDYDGAPTDGSAWVDGENEDRVVRGGSWSLSARSAYRSWCARADDQVGVRPARTIRTD